MSMLKRGDSWIHYGFADGRQTNKLQARNVQLTPAGELIVDLRHYEKPRKDLSDSDYMMVITTSAQLTSAVISDATVLAKVIKAGGPKELVIKASPAVTHQMPVSHFDPNGGFLKR